MKSTMMAMARWATTMRTTMTTMMAMRQATGYNDDNYGEEQ